MATLPKKPPAPPMKSKSKSTEGTGKKKPKVMMPSNRSDITGGGQAMKGINVSYAKGGMVKKASGRKC